MSAPVRPLGRPLPRGGGLLRAFRRSPVEFLERLREAGAAEAPLRVGPERVLLVDDPTAVWELLTRHARRTRKGRGIVRARAVLGNGLLTSEGEEHRRHRRALQPAFGPTAVAGYREHFVAAARRAGGGWADGAEIDLGAAMSGLTLDAVGSALFGAELRGRAPLVGAALTDLLAGFRLAMAPGGGVLLRSPLPGARRVRRARATLVDLVDDLVGGAGRGTGDRSGTVLDLFAGHPELSPGQVRDEAMTLLLAGHETTAMALVWAYAALEQDPEVRRECQAEWDAQVSPDEPSDRSRDDPVATLPVTMAVLAETLRLWPPVPLFTRRVAEPLDLGGRDVPVGTLGVVAPALLHRDPRWWTEPDTFRPERWLRRPPDEPVHFDPRAPAPPRGSYLPFGAGPRMCIGEHFAWVEAATVLAELGRRWRIRVPDAPLAVGPSGMTLRPRGSVRAVVHRVDPASPLQSPDEEHAGP